MSKKLYVTDSPVEVYTEKLEDKKEQILESMRSNNISKYRVRSIWAGPMLEIEGYPLWEIPQGKRKKNMNESSRAQKRINERNKAKRVARVVHTNFEMYKDIIIKLSYTNDYLPESSEQAHRNMTNYIRRLRHWLKKSEEYKDFILKYVFVTEYNDREGKKVRIHHHMITNFPDRDILEELWNRRGRVNAQKLQPDKTGVEALVWYLLKQPIGRNTKSYSISRNMKKPRITEADTKMTRKRAERIATGEIDVQEYFEKLYKGYQFVDAEIKLSDFTSGAYIYVRMKRIEPIKNIRKRE